MLLSFMVNSHLHFFMRSKATLLCDCIMAIPTTKSICIWVSICLHFCISFICILKRLQYNVESWNGKRIGDLYFDTYMCTMLQKLSKCEVKTWLCWNLIILLPFQFYVKSDFGKFKRSKHVIFGNFRDSELWILVHFGLESCSISYFERFWCIMH